MNRNEWRNPVRVAVIGATAASLVALAAGIGSAPVRAAGGDVPADMRKLVEASVGPQTGWDGPTAGPKALKDKSVVFVSLTQLSSGNLDASKGAEEAAKALGWKYRILDGQGSAATGAAALEQAIALKPDGIILGSISAENNKEILARAAAAGIKIVSWHSADKPGPIAGAPIYTNVSTDPYDIAYMAGAYAVVSSNGTAGADVITDKQYAIVVTKTNGIEDAIKKCSTCTLVSEDTVEFGQASQRTPAFFSSLLQRFGKKVTHVLTFNEIYFDFAVPVLKAAGIPPEGPPNLVAAGDGSVSAYQRIRNGQYQTATVPEPAYMHGWQLIDEMNRALSGAPPSGFVTKVHLVTKENVDADGGKDNRFDPANDYRGHYKAIWGVQ